jgi:hypothetical protein
MGVCSCSQVTRRGEIEGAAHAPSFQNGSKQKKTGAVASVEDATAPAYSLTNLPATPGCSLISLPEAHLLKKHMSWNWNSKKKVSLPPFMKNIYRH